MITLKHLLVFTCIILSVLLIAGCTEEDAYNYLQEHPDEVTAYFADHPDQINEYIAEHPEIMANITVPTTPVITAMVIDNTPVETDTITFTPTQTEIPTTTTEITTIPTTEVTTVVTTVEPTTEVTTMPTTEETTTIPTTEPTEVTVVTTATPIPEPTPYHDTRTGFPAIATIHSKWISSNPSQMINGEIGAAGTGMTGTGTYIVTTHSYISKDGSSWSGSLPTTITMGFTWIDEGDGNYQINGLADPLRQNETETRTAYYDQSSDTLTISGLSDTNVFVRG